MNTQTILTETAEDSIFGPVIHGYTRAQGIADGVLVDVSNANEGTAQACPFKYPVAMTRAAYDATVAAGGEWVAIENPTAEDLDTGCIEELRLPGGQDVQGRLHDVFTMAISAIRRASTMPVRRGLSTDGIWFSVFVDTHGNGRKTKVDLYSICGPGDNAEPVITILLRGED